MKKTSLDAEGAAILCRLLAQVDAVFRPWRKPFVPGWGSLWELRRDYSSVGLAWHSGGRDATARKAAERLLADLATAGRVRTFGPRGRVTGAKLTVTGEAEARRLCKLPGRAAALGMLAELQALHHELGGVVEAGPAANDGPFLPETLLARCEWGGEGFADRAWEVELFALPLMVGGLVVSRATVAGHVYYRVTPAGAALAEARAANGTKPGRKAWRCGEPAAEYVADRTRHKAALEAADGGTRDIGDCPLPVAGWSKDFAAKYGAKMAAMAGETAERRP